MKIKFCGAATDVTGSCHLISTNNHKVLLDCGQFQGGSDSDSLNRNPFPFNPAEIDAVVLSHAHIDHCGRLPLLVKEGFKGAIYATEATADLLDVMLKDSAHIHEQDALYQSKKLLKAGKDPIEPLYTASDVEDTLKLVEAVPYDMLIHVTNDMDMVFNDAGHILGSAIIELWIKEGEERKKLVFSGDIGMQHRPILKDPKFIKHADIVIMESTYGDRVHEPNPTSLDKLISIISDVCPKGGNVVIPSFAVGRTQELIYELNKIYDGHTPITETFRKIPVYVDSPMAINATEVFRKNAQTYDEEARAYLMKGDHPLTFNNLHYSSTSDESKQINVDTVPKVIISASGMCDAGRIRHHLKYNLSRPESAVVFVGYQAVGTLGRTIVEGAKTVKLFGEEVSVRAKIFNLAGFSGHADRDGLLSWLDGFMDKPKNIFLVHGEEKAKTALAEYIKEKKGWDSTPIYDYIEVEV